MRGLGDGVYQRPIVRHLTTLHEELWIATPWPELYRDLRVRFYHKPQTHHTQIRNAIRNASVYETPPEGEESRITYGMNISHQGIVGAMEAALGHTPHTFPYHLDLPPGEPETDRRPYVLVNPVSVRKEWTDLSRNCLPGYIADAAHAARGWGFNTIGLGAFNNMTEFCVYPPPPLDIDYTDGRLKISKLMALFRGAAGVICPVGFALPMALAAKVPVLCVWGGRGKYNNPKNLVDERIDSSLLVNAIPDPHCNCVQNDHDCQREIPDFEDRAIEFMELVRCAH